MTRYDWSKLDAGWKHSDGILTECSPWARRQWGVKTLEASRPNEASADAHIQLAKCRIRDTERAPVDNTPLFEAMDRMSVEVPKEEWIRVPSYQMGVAYDHRELELGDGFFESWVTPPPPPWRRGPLAAWTLVNISCHDGRLTVVMKRGRGELVIETGPDDEFLWVRLEQKVVDLDKAKACTT